MNPKKRILLSVSGFDPSGGAGALLDVRVFERHGFHGMAILTGLAVQNTCKVQRVLPYTPQTLMSQYTTLVRDVSFAGIKTGMIGSKANATVLGRILLKHPGIPKVIDPVMLASSGARLMEAKALPSFLKTVCAGASLLTPNMSEASIMAGIPVASPHDMRQAAQIIFSLTSVPCLVKGGHLEKSAINVFYDGRKTALFGHEKIPADVHGTGCFLSSSILAYLAKGYSLERACALASDSTHRAIRTAVKPGKGRNIFSFH